jgi:hypothetical protein
MHRRIKHPGKAHRSSDPHARLDFQASSAHASTSRLLPNREESARSWTAARQEIETKNFDLEAVNPNAKNREDTRTPDELLDLIEAKAREVTEAMAVLRRPTQ